MNGRCILRVFLFFGILAFPAFAAPVIDPIPTASIPAGKTLILTVTASSPNGRPLTFTATSSTNRITIGIHTNNPFWKMSVVQAAAGNAPGAYQTPFRGGVVTVTNIGDMTFMLFRDLAPHTVDVIQGLTAGGLYTSNTIFHRVVPGFVIQGGDPNTNGSGGLVFRYDDEFHRGAIFSGNGQLALANSGKDTDGSQFFVTAGPQRFLDFGYTLFGQLVRGFNVLTNVINTPANGAARPLADVIITRASFVPDNFDTVLTLTGTNSVGVAGTISVIADDGAGGRATNSFTATTVTDTQNDPPFLITFAITNLIVPINGRLTNSLSALDLESNAMYYGFSIVDLNTYLNSTMVSFNGTNGQFVIVPNASYSGPLSFSFAVSPNTNFSPCDSQTYTFAVGDTAISALASNFTAQALSTFTNQLIASFTNSVPNSATNNFAASINWGDNVISGGVIVSNLAGRKEVRGSHTYTNVGNYPVYLTVLSAFGARTTVVCTASVPPALGLARTGTNNVVRWPAWATDYQLQSTTNVAAPNWPAVTNFPALTGYDSVTTNSTTNGACFFRLKK
jgi:cyclophilin family peptidyl-prolyl cis-trans isomerase